MHFRSQEYHERKQLGGHMENTFVFLLIYKVEMD